MSATEVLKEEHRVIERVLDVLDALTQMLEMGKDVRPEVFEEALDFIRIFADRCHHGKEEDRLFSLMVKRGFPKEGGPIAVMLQEHTLGRNFVKSMAAAVEKYRGGDKTAKEGIIRNARGYVNLLRQHIMKEDNILYLMADGTLTADDQRSLLEEFEEFERKEIGEGVHERYHKLAEKLETEARL